MTVYRKLIYLTTLLITVSSFSGRFRNVDDLLRKIDTYNKLNPQEKLYVHFDRETYAPGDTMYIKAYLINAYDNTPSLRSRVLYIDLMDDKDSVDRSLRLPVENGIAWGSIPFSDTM